MVISQSLTLSFQNKIYKNQLRLNLFLSLNMLFSHRWGLDEEVAHMGDSIIIKSWWEDEQRPALSEGLLTKCCQKCCVEKHVDSAASQWVRDTSKQHISEAAEVVEHHANFKSVNASHGEAIRRKCHLMGWQRIKGSHGRQQQT